MKKLNVKTFSCTSTCGEVTTDLLTVSKILYELIACSHLFFVPFLSSLVVVLYHIADHIFAEKAFVSWQKCDIFGLNFRESAEMVKCLKCSSTLQAS